MTHTVGPWKANDHETYFSITDANDMDVSTHVYYRCNARLIAAAPDMLAALEYAAQHIEIADTREYVYSIITKAKGQSE